MRTIPPGYSVYIAGPMRGIKNYNWESFTKATRCLRGGYELTVISPAEMAENYGFVRVTYKCGCYRDNGILYDLTGSYYPTEHNDALVPLSVEPTDLFDIDKILAADLKALERVDELVLLPGWEYSEGYDLEIAHAKRFGLKISNIADWGCVLATPSRYCTDHEPGPTTTIETGSEETMVVDPITGGQKGTKLARFDLLPPDTMVEIAKHFGRGALKHADRNWERGYAWGLSYAALNRHLAAWWGGEEIDDKTGGHHLDAVAVHAMFLRTFVLRGIGTDDRGKP